MGLFSGAARILSFLARLGAFISSVIVLGILGRMFWRLHRLHRHYGRKLIYVISLATLSIPLALLLLLPFMFTFWAFPLDFAFFVMWMVAFALLTNVRLISHFPMGFLADRKCTGTNARA